MLERMDLEECIQVCVYIKYSGTQVWIRYDCIYQVQLYKGMYKIQVYAGT